MPQWIYPMRYSAADFHGLAELDPQPTRTPHKGKPERKVGDESRFNNLILNPLPAIGIRKEGPE